MKFILILVCLAIPLSFFIENSVKDKFFFTKLLGLSIVAGGLIGWCITA